MRLPVLLCLATVLYAADNPKLPPKLDNIVRLAQSAPPEFSADALLQVVESGEVSDKDQRQDLIEQAFNLAAGAHFRLPMRGYGGLPSDSAAGLLAKAYALKLDALSLQSRATRAMIAVNPARGREMFTAMPPPAIQPLTCSDALVYELSGYYQALSAVMQSSFTAKERASEDHIAFLLPYLAQAQSPAQLFEMAKILREINVTSSQRELLLARFAGVLADASSDDRSFSAELGNLSKAVDLLGGGEGLNAALQKYTAHHETAEHCGKDSVKPGVFWQDSTAQPLVEAAKKLRFAPDGSRALTEAERRAPEWQRQLEDFRQQLANWTGDGGSEIDLFNQKALLYENLIELVPADTERTQITAEFEEFLNSSRLANESPAEWFQPVRTLLDRLQADPESSARILAQLESSGNPILSLYAALERTFPRPYPAFVLAPRGGG